jgi:hypothetical protein
MGYNGISCCFDWKSVMPFKDWPTYKSSGGFLSEDWARQDLERKEEERRMLENAQADAKAVWALADYYMPADIKEMAERWKIDNILQEMWRGAFIEGWRAAHRKN